MQAFAANSSQQHGGPMFRSARIFCLWSLLAVPAFSAPPLTTIQDVLYNADGSRFTGLVFIEWKSFQAGDASNVPMQSKTVKIVNGTLLVKLVPTTNASAGAYYSVLYNSDGKAQFTERWAVSPSAIPLKLSDIRISSTAVLPPDPVMESIPEFADSETPADSIDGVNASFTLAFAPFPAASLLLYRNGLLQRQGSDYTLSGKNILFVPASVPAAGDTLVAFYRYPRVD